MPDRHGFPLHQTYRPDPEGTAAAALPSAVLPTIADVLRLDAMTVAAPEVLAGRSGLERSVRWVHVTETASVAGLVSGGELLLSTGVGWPQHERELVRYVDEVDRAGVAGLVLELGRRFATAPEPLISACAERGIPLIVLHSQARFIAITEAVHSRIIADQMNALRARDDIHALFTELSLRGSPADFIVEQLGQVLGAPVVLEDLAHRVIAAAVRESDGDALAGWEQASRAAHRAAAGASPAGLGGPGSVGNGWLIVPVEARGTRWGYLIALPGRAHPAGRANVLEQGAVALALSRLADRDEGEWLRHSHQALLTTLLGGRYRSEVGLRERFEAAGLPIVDRHLIGIALAGAAAAGIAGPGDLVGHAVGPSSAQLRDAARDIGAEAVAGTSADAPGSLIAILSFPRRERVDDHTIDAFARALAAVAGTRDLSLALGSEAYDIRGVLASLDEARELLARRVRARGIAVYRAESRPLLRLIASFADDPRMQAHSEQMLRPLIEYDIANDGDLLDVLAAYAEHPGNRTRAATASHLSRSVFYQRIALIEDLLDADLDNGETVSALHAALLARRRSAR
ncbi:PucR family transcriptional regulator [Rathayibacter soli]|uniref:PucR family transcriptional regulator n=1 Tax=Rathayibacter soli TaxID=3144168 RepID=UPI0027E426CC|nr:PucR family transcriptional regulator [Glaciibacter superstes]